MLLHPNNHKSLLPRGHRPSLALCTSDRWPYVCELGHLPAADPPVAPTSFNVLELSGETTVAAGLPLNQLGTKMSAGRLCELSDYFKIYNNNDYFILLMFISIIPHIILNIHK